ncbi:MAG: hypothetical protein KAT39_04810 [Alphaproteobacteria bacterium]|nr:hypothetical protein [Alphaproteobacteria bacterium]
MMLGNDPQTFGEAFPEALERYLGETLHDRVSVDAIEGTISVPTFLERSYRFYKARIIGRQCVLIAARENAATPADIAKHVSLVRSAVDTIVIFAAPSLSAHNRSRLIAQGVAFVVPGNQLYIPELAMDLREYFRAPKPRGAKGLSPAAQAVFFHYLLRLDEYATTPSAIAKRLRYSAMSIGRAFDDLVAVGLVKSEKRGKERHIYFTADRRELMESARPLLRSPVRSVKHVRNDRPVPNLKLAGETALAKLTNLTPPRTETFAVLASDWKMIAEILDFIEVDEFEETFAVETWSYDPAGLSYGPVVDPLSLYAQFRDHRDERISMAAERLLENVIW